MAKAGWGKLLLATTPPPDRATLDSANTGAGLSWAWAAADQRKTGKFVGVQRAADAGLPAAARHAPNDRPVRRCLSCAPFPDAAPQCARSRARRFRKADRNECATSDLAVRLDVRIWMGAAAFEPCLASACLLVQPFGRARLATLRHGPGRVPLTVATISRSPAMRMRATMRPRRGSRERPIAAAEAWAPAPGLR